MKIRNKILIATIFSYFFAFGTTIASLDHFEVKLSPDNLKAGEALDFSIEAKDKNNSTVKDYTGMVLIFSESDPEAQLPTVLKENTYTFTSSDQGKVIFENSVKFLQGGKQNIYVYDFNNDSVFGIGEVNIIKNEESQNIRVDILSPENGLTIGSDSIKVSGSSNKNHKIKILLDGKEVATTTTNNNGIYEIEVKNLIEGENTIKAQVLDGTEKVVGESNEVKIKISKNNLSIKNVKTIPSEVDSEGAYEIEVNATEGLREVTVVVNDVIITLEEKTPGVYVAKSFAPKNEGTYAIDVIIKDELGHDKKELGAGNLKVKVIELNSAEVVEKTEEDEDKGPDLTISGLKLVELKTRSILTWNKVSAAESYNVYKKHEDGKLELITNVDEPKFELEITGDEVTYEYFAVKAVAKDDEGEIYEGSLSEATKVKTGPELLILLIISLLAGFLYLYSKQKRA